MENKMNNHWKLILIALENHKYKWRTIEGISKETGLEPKTIKNELQNHDELIIQSSIQSINGEDLYTSRAHYRKKSSVIERITSSIINKAST